MASVNNSINSDAVADGPRGQDEQQPALEGDENDEKDQRNLFASLNGLPPGEGSNQKKPEMKQLVKQAVANKKSTQKLLQSMKSR